MRYSHTYPDPTKGVSTLAARNQPDGMMLEQTNMRSDPLTKLTRRKSMTAATILDTSEWKAYNRYTRGDNTIEIGIDGSSDIRVYINGIEEGLTETDYTKSTYVTSGVEEDFRIHTLNDTTFILNTTATVGRTPKPWPFIPDTVWPMVNVISALNYGEKVTLELSWSTASKNGLVYSSSATEQLPYTSIEVAIPNAVGSDYTVADEKRATYAVAEEIKTKLVDIDLYIWTGDDIYTGIQGSPFEASEVKGSTVVIYPDTVSKLHVDVATGQGESSVKVFNSVIQDIEGLPKYAIEGTILNVQAGAGADTTSGYYLKAVKVGSAASSSVMKEIYWKETATDQEMHTLNGSTMPIAVLIEEGTNGSFSVKLNNSTEQWTARDAGDDESNPFPSFVGERITAMETFQGRLVLSGESEVLMSSTEDIYNYFRKSVLQLLTTDTVALGSSSTYANTITHMAVHDSDLIVNYRKAQLKVSGSAPVTPQTGTLSPSTTFDTTSVPKPLVFGTSLLLPFSYGESGGVWDYTQREQNEQNTAMPITRIVEGYLVGDIQKWAASTSLGMVVIKCSEENSFFVYEQETVNGKRTQMSWSKWEFTDLGDVLWLGFEDNVLHIVTRDGTNTASHTIDMGHDSLTKHIYLDDLLTITVPDGDTIVTLPSTYLDVPEIIYVQGDDCTSPRKPVLCERIGTSLTVPVSIHKGGSDSTLYIGRPFTSSFTIPQQYVRNEAGIDTTDNIRVKKLVLDVVNTNKVLMDTVSKYTETTTSEINSDKIGKALLGKVNYTTGDMPFSYKQKASDANAKFYTDGHLGMNVIGISWEGLYNSRMRRI